MKEEEKKTDALIRQLFMEAELRNPPEGLNDRIMHKILITGNNEIKSPFYIRYSWVLLFIAVSLLPSILKMIQSNLTNFISNNAISINISMDSLYLLILIFFASAILLIAEKLIRFSFPRKSGLNL